MTERGWALSSGIPLFRVALLPVVLFLVHAASGTSAARRCPIPMRPATEALWLVLAATLVLVPTERAPPRLSLVGHADDPPHTVSRELIARAAALPRSWGPWQDNRIVCYHPRTRRRKSLSQPARSRLILTPTLVPGTCERWEMRETAPRARPAPVSLRPDPARTGPPVSRPAHEEHLRAWLDGPWATACGTAGPERTRSGWSP